jgi:hypothetical protein
MESKEFGAALSQLNQVMPDIINRALFLGAEVASGKVQNRIFSQLEDIDGNSFGSYKSEAYKKYRASLGRQVSEKDLQLFGNAAQRTGLIGSFKVVDPATCIMEDKPDKDGVLPSTKARGQEKQLGKRIFEISEKEIDEVTVIIENEAAKQIERFFAGEI